MDVLGPLPDETGGQGLYKIRLGPYGYEYSHYDIT
jgi:hypothetical protein